MIAGVRVDALTLTTGMDMGAGGSASDNQVGRLQQGRLHVKG